LTQEYLAVLRDSLVAGGRDSLSPHTISSLLQEAVSVLESLIPTCASANSDAVELVGGREQAHGDASGASEIFDAPHHVRPIKGDLADVVEAFVALLEACHLTRGSLSSSTAARVRQLLVTLNVSSTSARGQARVTSASALRVSSSAHPLACTLESRVKAVISAVSTSISCPPPQRGTWKRTRNRVDSLQTREQEEGCTNGAKESKRGVGMARMQWMLPPAAANSADSDMRQNTHTRSGTGNSRPPDTPSELEKGKGAKPAGGSSAPKASAKKGSEGGKAVTATRKPPLRQLIDQQLRQV
jgi:hypothetical protein